jgi:hypothetical protein
VLGAGDLEGKSKSAVLVQVGGVGLEFISHLSNLLLTVEAYQVQGTSGVLRLVGVLDKVEQTLSGLAGPRSNTVGNLGLFAAEVLPEVGRWDGLIAEPEVLLRKAEGAAMFVSRLFKVVQFGNTHFFRPGAL